MVPTAANVLVFVQDVEDALPDGLIEALADTGPTLHRVTRSDALATLAAWSMDGAAPAAVVLAAHLVQPLTVASQVYQATPLVHQVFVAGPERRSNLQRDMMPSHLGGCIWTIVDPGTVRWGDVLRRAVRATRQRSTLRTTLDRMNQHRASRRGVVAEHVRRLGASDSYLASILEHAGDAIVAVDEHDRIVSWNRGAALLFGCGEAEVQGRPIDVLVPGEQREEPRRLVHDALAGRSTTRHGIRSRRVDDTPFDAEVTVAPVRDGAQDVTAVSVIVRDVTRRNRYEASLYEANVRLQQALEALEEKTSQSIDAITRLEVLATTDAMTVSIGVAGYGPNDTSASLVKRASVAAGPSDGLTAPRWSGRPARADGSDRYRRHARCGRRRRRCRRPRRATSSTTHALRRATPTARPSIAASP